MTAPVAITFDWYGTLAEHRHGIGRGRQFRDYLASQGLSGDPWDRRVLDEVFDYYAGVYRPDLSDAGKRSVWTECTRLLFRAANVCCTPDRAGAHAEAIADIFGASGFRLYAETKETLSALKGQNLRLGVISNWHRGLNAFCEELGIARYFDVIIASADVGCEKPDSRIFEEALTRLRTSAVQTLHVGDSMREDVEGATAAGLHALLVDRRGVHHGYAGRSVSDLHGLERLFR